MKHRRRVKESSPWNKTAPTQSHWKAAVIYREPFHGTQSESLPTLAFANIISVYEPCAEQSGSTFTASVTWPAVDTWSHLIRNFEAHFPHENSNFTLPKSQPKPAQTEHSSLANRWGLKYTGREEPITPTGVSHQDGVRITVRITENNLWIRKQSVQNEHMYALINDPENDVLCLQYSGTSTHEYP